MKVVKHILDKQKKIKLTVKALPDVGHVVHIQKRDKSNYGGKRKDKYGTYEIKKIYENGLFLTENVTSKIKECFTTYDFMYSSNILWYDKSSN